MNDEDVQIPPHDVVATKTPWWRRVVRGRPEDPAWARPALLGLLALAAVLYLWALGRSGWANSYYAAAVQAGTQSWKAWFFGSFDSANYITVDKTPASLWVMVLSARIFGLNSWSLLVPQALMGVGTVALTYAAVKRWWGSAGGLLAGAVVALTPVAVLMFRYNNPDALLTLLLAGAAYATLRAIEGGKTRWLLLAGTLVGFGFLDKMLQAFLVVPGLGLAYLIAGPPKLGKRIWQLALTGVAIVVSAGWWVAIVELWPKASRPFIGGSTTNSILQLTFGYNGLGRITGNEAGAVVGGGPVTANVGGGMWGQAGLFRLFGSEMGSQISWLMPAALIALVVGLWLAGRAKRTNMLRAAMVVWGSWMLVTGLTFSFMAGIIHPYYNVVMAPAIGALLGIVIPELWRGRKHIWRRAVLAATVAVTASWSFELLSRSPNWMPWLRSAILIGGLVAAAAILASGWLPVWRVSRAVAAGIAVLALAASLGGTSAYALSTAAHAHTGPIPSAGPAGAGGGFGGLMANLNGNRNAGRQRQDGNRQLPTPSAGAGQFPGQNGGQMPAPGGNTQGNQMPNFGGFGGRGGLEGDVNVSDALVALLQKDAGSYRWAGVMTSANNAASVQLAARVPIMAIGGFNGTDQSMTLAQFQQIVAERQAHYYIGGGGFGGSANSGVAAQIATWVGQNFTASTVGSTSVYDLTAPAAGG